MGLRAPSWVSESTSILAEPNSASSLCEAESAARAMPRTLAVAIVAIAITIAATISAIWAVSLIPGKRWLTTTIAATRSSGYFGTSAAAMGVVGELLVALCREQCE